MTDPTDRSSTEPSRWSDGATDGNGAERAIGALLGRVRQASEPSAAAVQRLRSLRERGPSSSTQIPKHRPVWRLAVVAVVIMATGSAVGAALNRWAQVDLVDVLGLRRLSRPDATSINDRPRNRRRSAGQAAMVTPGSSDAVAPAVNTTGEAPPPVAQLPAIVDARNDAPHPAQSPPRERTRARVAPAPSGPEPAAHGAAAPLANVDVGPAGEAEPLAAAFRELRSGGQPAAALRLLNEYEQRFPGGALRGEARVARAEALLTLGRGGEALRVLDEIENQGGTLTRDLRITRGELFAANGDCENAVRDFEALLGGSRDDAVTARALFGRASCRLRRGEMSAARRDLERYLVIQPDGPSAADARRALQSIR
ncbi:MAG: tetratricopeptide repeat protein [Myxococcales bacterium]